MAGFFAGLDLVEPGLVRVPEWRPALAIDAAAPAQMWAGVALKSIRTIEISDRRQTMAFTEEEAAYLRSQPLARIATVGPDGQPDVAPVGFEFDGTYLYVGGRAPERTRKFLNVKAGQAKVALVVDDLVSTDPWTPRGLRVYGTAELIERSGMFGPGAYMRITPEISWSWNLAGQPYGAGGQARAGPSTTGSR